MVAGLVAVLVVIHVVGGCCLRLKKTERDTCTTTIFNRLVNCEVATMGNRAEETHQLKEENRFRFRAPLDHKNHHQLLQHPYDIMISANPSDDGAGQQGIMHHHKILALSKPSCNTDTRCAAPGGTKQDNGMCLARSINQKLGECDYSSTDNAAAFIATVCPA